MELRPYQQEALQAVSDALARGVSKQLIVLPTGCGKTVIFTSLGKAIPDAFPMLVVAHREELLDQAAAKFAATEPDLKVGKEQAENHADLDCDIVVASVATIGRANSDRTTKWQPDHFRTIVIDEAHHAAAQSYRRVLDYFSPQLVLGVTATPQRGDSVGLNQVFDEVVFYRSILEMIEQGWLCPLVGYRVGTTTDLSDVKVANGDYVESDLVQAIDTPERNALIVKAYHDLAGKKPTLIFAAGVQHAEDIRSAFRTQSPETHVDCVLGDTTSNDRNSLYDSLREGSLDVLINVGVLTEGFDEPSVGCIILARPTRSSGLYTQIVGRGTRLYHDKLRCIVVDMADVTNGKKPVGLPTLLGLPPDFDLDGKDVLEAYKAVSKLAQKSPESASRVRSFDDIDAEYTLIDIFRPPKPSQVVLEHSNYIWAEVAEDTFSIACGPYRVNIIPSALRFDVVIAKDNLPFVAMAASELREAFNMADTFITTELGADAKLYRSDAAWRGDGPTEKQQKFLRRIGVPVTTDMTKGEASLIISKYIDEHPRSFAQQKAIEASKRKRMPGGW